MALIDNIINRNITTRGIQDARDLAYQIGGSHDAELIAKFNQLQYNLTRSQITAYTPAQMAVSRQLAIAPYQRITSITNDNQRAAVINFITATTSTARGYRAVMRDKAQNIRDQMKRVTGDLVAAGKITKKERAIINKILRRANAQQIQKIFEAYGGLIHKFAQQSDEYMETISGRFLAAIQQNQKAGVKKIIQTLTSKAWTDAEKNVFKDKTNTYLKRNLSAEDAAEAFKYTRGF